MNNSVANSARNIHNIFRWAIAAECIYLSKASASVTSRFLLEERIFFASATSSFALRRERRRQAVQRGQCGQLDLNVGIVPALFQQMDQLGSGGLAKAGHDHRPRARRAVGRSG